MQSSVAIWFMEGVSSQKNILALVNQARLEGGHDFQLIASHRTERPEILAEADVAYLEPADNHDLLPFIERVCEKHRVVAIHAGKRGELLEKYRTEIAALGVKLTTGARHIEVFELADNKARFSERMADQGLRSVHSIEVQTPDEVAAAVSYFESHHLLPCIKPVRGIYGMGFWILQRSPDYLSFFNNPDRRQINPEVVIAALRSAAGAGEKLPLQIVMPWLIGPECSVDMLVENGDVIAAVARSKSGSIQTIENHGPAYELAVECAMRLKADGLVNVQTRNDENGHPVLLEANLRPSGGIGYSAFSGVNLPGLFALRQLGLITAAEVQKKLTHFNTTKVIPTHDVKPLPVCSLSTLDNVASQV